MTDVSCVIPFYDGGDTIARAIDSVIYNALCLEVLVVVDASPQPLNPHLTPAQVRLLTTGKLRVVQLGTNHGQACARNIGAAMSTGAYISFLDQDDMYLRGYYEPVVSYLEANPKIAALEVGAEFVHDGRVVLDTPDPRYGAAIHSVPWNVVVRRGAFWACGGFPVGPEFRSQTAGEDIVFKTALKRWFSVSTVSDKFVRHHVRNGSATDRYIKRTKVVDGEVIFDVTYDNEADGSVHAAADAHLARAEQALQAQRKLS